MNKTLIFAVIALALFVLILFAARKNEASPPPLAAGSSEIASRKEAEALEIKPELGAPLARAIERITKKPFGIHVTPQNSPVSPEKFTGIHTGTDFETFTDEQNIDVSVYAICDGKILQKGFGRGYGGMIVQSCTLEDEPITIVYGHVQIASANVKIGDTIQSGDFLAYLGTGGSDETDGERKHLHLGIHKGAKPDTRGYVASESELSEWIDFEKFL